MTDTAPIPGHEPVLEIDTTRAHTARLWNYLLGGKDNYPVDRELGEQVLALIPGLAATARAVRASLVRAAQYLAGYVGSR